MIDRRQVLSGSAAGLACAAAGPTWAEALSSRVGRSVSIGETFLPRAWLAAFSRHVEATGHAADRAFWDHAQGQAGETPAAVEGELQLITLPAPGVEPFAPRLAGELARRSNDRLAEVVAGSRGALGGLATISAFDPGAAREAERALTRLGLAGISLGANRGMRLSHPELRPVFEVAQAAGVPVYLPASYGAMAGDAPYRSLNRAGVIEGAAAESRDHAAQLIFAGVIDAFPRLTFILGRLGEAAPYWYRDLVVAEGAYEADAVDAPRRDVASYFRSNLYLTTADMESVGTREFCESVVGRSRLLPFKGASPGGAVTYAALRSARIA